jgi:nucleoside-diphosphate-sugar epimerase
VALFLVTGGGGFIGSNLVETILGSGDSVRVMDDFSTGRRRNLLDAAEWARRGGGSFALVEADIRDLEACRAATSGVDYVLHQAAMPSVPRSIEDPLNSSAVNIDGTLNLLVAARDARVRRFVYASSSSLYGESDVLPKVETMAPAPISPYGLQKLAGETYCALFHRLYGLPTVALRYFNVFGPRQNPDSEYAAVVPRFVQAIRDGGRPVVFGDGEQTRDFTHIRNAVRANLLACESGARSLGQAFNIACGTRISLNRLIELIAELAGRPVTARYDPPRKGDIRDSLADIGKARELLGFTPEVGVEDGLRLLWESG